MHGCASQEIKEGAYLQKYKQIRNQCFVMEAKNITSWQCFLQLNVKEHAWLHRLIQESFVNGACLANSTRYKKLMHVFVATIFLKMLHNRTMIVQQTLTPTRPVRNEFSLANRPSLSCKGLSQGECLIVFLLSIYGCILHVFQDMPCTKLVSKAQ